MKKNYWNVNDKQVIENTGKSISAWIKILDKFNAIHKKPGEVVTLLHEEYDVLQYWAGTLTTSYFRHKNNSL